MSTVLVTGGSGFIGGHAILQLLAAGHRVHATLRSLDRAPEVLNLLKQGSSAPGAALSFFEADLKNDEGWGPAVAGCEYVLHIASPFPAGTPKHEDELIVPAREGTLRVLRAAREAGVRRVVLTSSFAAIGYGQSPQPAVYDESNWTNTDARLSAYVRSKTLAERAAWDFIAREGGALELAAVNPAAVFGPVLTGPHLSTSVRLIRSMLDGTMPVLPRLWFGAVDVRDVADLHLRAMTDPAARGERFLAVGGDSMSLADMARALRTRMGAAARRVSARQAPDWLIRLAALFNPAAREILPELGREKHVTNAKAKRVLGWAPRSNEEALIAAGESLLRLGLLKHESRAVDRPVAPAAGTHPAASADRTNSGSS
jgi:nucleoside-diphosphate-sugar epimerase